MKIVDANVLLYAVNADAPNHRQARAWLERTLSASETVGFTWVVLLAFLLLATRPAIFPHPLRLDEAVDVIETWLAQPSAVILEPTTRHLAVLRDLLTPFGTAGNLTSDANLAAIAIEHGAEVCSADNDYARFPGLRWSNPLA